MFAELEDGARALVEDVVRLIDVAVEAQSYGYLTEITTLTKSGDWATRYLRELGPELVAADLAVLTQPVRPSFLQDYEEAVWAACSLEEFETVRREYFWIKGSYETQPPLTLEMMQADAQSQAHVFDASVVARKARLMAGGKQAARLRIFVHVLETLIALQDQRKANVLRLNYVLRRLITRLQTHAPEWSSDELLSREPIN